MTNEQTASLLAYLAGAYGRSIDDRTAQVWANTFADDDYDPVARAAQRWIDEQERFPTPAGLRGLVRDELRRQQMNAPTRSLESGAVVPPDEGFQIAYRAYCGEVRRQGREPRSFDEFRHGLPIGS